MARGDRKKSLFPQTNSILSSDTFDFVRSGTNYKIPFSDLQSQLGVTGTLSPKGAVSGVQVLDGTSPNYEIRNIESGSGVAASVSPNDGVKLDHSFQFDTTGIAISGNPSDNQPVIRSIAGVFPLQATLNGDVIEISSPDPQAANLVIVQQASDLSGTLDPTKEYVIDGVVDMGSQSIEVPAGGLNIRGWNFNVSKLISSANNYTMFTSPVSGSGDVLGADYAIEVTGANSQVYDLKAVDNFRAFEFERINYNNCVSLGQIDSYRQG